MPDTPTPQALLQRGEALLAEGALIEARDAFTEVLAHRPRDGAALRGLGKAQLDLGDTAGATESFRQALAIVPYDLYAAHMLASLTGEANARASGYVPDLFDTYAESFDDHLTGALGYRIPQVIRALLADHPPFAALIDIGCGTGLVGAALADRVTAMDGIDIAPRMTRKALERGIYRHLRTGDAAAILGSDPALAGPYDLAIAADVFVYLGALEPIFAAVTSVLAPDGLFIFSVETAEGPGPALRSSGRFAHPGAYIDQLAALFGFAIAARHPQPIRNERDNPIPGMLYRLKRG